MLEENDLDLVPGAIETALAQLDPRRANNSREILRPLPFLRFLLLNEVPAEACLTFVGFAALSARPSTTISRTHDIYNYAFNRNNY